ncbi:MAG: hypothetical protein C4297_02220 [Gemmataceae bacterium]
MLRIPQAHAHVHPRALQAPQGLYQFQAELPTIVGAVPADGVYDHTVLRMPRSQRLASYRIQRNSRAETSAHQLVQVLRPLFVTHTVALTRQCQG